MQTLRFLAALTVAAAFSFPASAADLTRIDRTIVKEPAYTSSPKYCLLVFGADVKTRVWLVHDGDTLYVDRNGNGDLTETGEKVTAKKNKYVAADEGVYDFEAGDIGDGRLVHKALRCYVGKLEHAADYFDDVRALLSRNPQARGYYITCDVEMPGRTGIGIEGQLPCTAIS